MPVCYLKVLNGLMSAAVGECQAVLGILPRIWLRPVKAVDHFCKHNASRQHAGVGPCHRRICSAAKLGNESHKNGIFQKTKQLEMFIFNIIQIGFKMNEWTRMNEWMNHDMRMSDSDRMRQKGGKIGPDCPRAHISTRFVLFFTCKTICIKPKVFLLQRLIVRLYFLSSSRKTADGTEIVLVFDFDLAGLFTRSMYYSPTTIRGDRWQLIAIL